MNPGWLVDEGFEVRIETSAEIFGDPLVHDLDLVIPIYTMSTIQKPHALNLCEAVRNGVGLAGHHGGMCDAFRDSVDYQFMCGGQWVAHPGNIIDYRVDVAKPDDPIMQGIEGFHHRSEQYYMHVDPAVEVLATTTFSGEHAPWTKGVVMPQVWKKMYGKGRVFYSALGHRPTSSTCRQSDDDDEGHALGGALTGTETTTGRATLDDVARAAGVSIATADRVVNRRDGVRAATVAKVEEAILRLGYRTDPLATRLARNRSHRFAFILPTGANSFMTLLEEQVRRTAERLAADRAFIDVIHTDVFDPAALAGALENLPDHYHGVAVVALDHARVRARSTIWASAACRS